MVDYPPKRELLQFKKSDEGVVISILETTTATSENKGKVSAKMAKEKTYQEYETFNNIQFISSDFDKMIKTKALKKGEHHD